MAKQYRNHLRPGHPAPAISTRDVFGNKLSLKTLNSRYILLVFFRYAGCPWCNLALHRLSLEYQTLKDHGCEVITFLQSDSPDIIENVYERHAQKPQFAIVADPERQHYQRYGVSNSLRAGLSSLKHIPIWAHSVRQHGFAQKKVDGNLFLVPASFLIDGRTNTIIQTSYGASYYDTEAFMDIYQSVFYKEL